jgi:hypothetical protein
MKIKKMLPFSLFLCFLLALSSLIIYFQKRIESPFQDLSKSETVFLVSEKSFFHNFTVIEQTVEFRCYLTLVNTSNDIKSVYLYAYSSKDKNRLVEDGKLFAVDEENKMVLFTIPPQKTIIFKNVYFKGKFGGKESKFDRLLPDILVVEQLGAPSRLN